MATVITPEELFFGTPVSLTVGGVEAGATTEPPTWEFEVEEFTPEFQGAGGPVKGTKVIRRVRPRVNLRVNEITAEKLAWALGNTSSVTTSTAEVGGGTATTLSAPSAIGDTVVTVTDETGYAVNDFIRIGAAGPTAEYRQILAINAAANQLTLDRQLARAHAAAATVTEVEGDGRTTISFRIGRVPTSDYRDVVLIGEGLDGRQMRVELDDCASSENQELSFADDDITGLNLQLEAHYAPEAPRVVPMRVVLL